MFVLLLTEGHPDKFWVPIPTLSAKVSLSHSATLLRKDSGR